MYYYIAEIVVKIVVALAVTLIGVGGAWLSAKLAKRGELANINAAQQELVSMAQLTVGELQQTIVDGMKEFAADGKLTNEDMLMLGNMLVEKTINKMSEPSIKLLEAAGVDIIALIHGAGEAMISRMKSLP